MFRILLLLVVACIPAFTHHYQQGGKARRHGTSKKNKSHSSKECPFLIQHSLKTDLGKHSMTISVEDKRGHHLEEPIGVAKQQSVSLRGANA